MHTRLANIVEVFQKRAKVCATAAEDAAQEALTGDACNKAAKTQDAQDWLIRSKVWLEAEEIVREQAFNPPDSGSAT
jgi:hypothetical protein